MTTNESVQIDPKYRRGKLTELFDNNSEHPPMELITLTVMGETTPRVGYATDGEYDVWFDFENGYAGSSLLDAVRYVTYEELMSEQAQLPGREQYRVTAVLTEYENSMNNRTGLNVRDFQQSAYAWLCEWAYENLPKTSVHGLMLVVENQ